MLLSASLIIPMNYSNRKIVSLKKKKKKEGNKEYKKKLSWKGKWKQEMLEFDRIELSK